MTISIRTVATAKALHLEVVWVERIGEWCGMRESENGVG